MRSISILAGCACLLAALPAGASAAGQQIVFESHRVAGGDGELYSMAPDGSGLVRLTNHPGSDTDPAVSPDGRKIAWISYTGGEGLDLWVMRSNGAKAKRILRTVGVDEFDPAWSPDGTQLAFEQRSPRGNLQIAVVTASGRGYHVIATGATDNRDPAWSPDGSRIAFVSLRDGPQDLYTMAPDGSDVRRLTADPATADTPVYSPDGSKIVLAWNHALAIVPTAGGVASPIGLPVPPGTTSQAPSFSPDGARLAFDTNLGDGYGEIATANLDGSDMRFPAPNTTGGLMATDIKPSWGLRS